MPRHRRFELDELANRPGTYFNPQTEVLLVVDDSPEIDQELFDMEELEAEDWILVSDNLPIDESARDELIERFQVASERSASRATPNEDIEEEPDEPDEDEEVDEE